jgi:hypothetical protein
MNWMQGAVIAAVVIVSGLFLWFVRDKYMK